MISCETPLRIEGFSAHHAHPRVVYSPINENPAAPTTGSIHTRLPPRDHTAKSDRTADGGLRQLLPRTRSMAAYRHIAPRPGSHATAK